MANMRGSEMQEQTLERLEQDRICMSRLRSSEIIRLHVKYRVYPWPFTSTVGLSHLQVIGYRLTIGSKVILEYQLWLL